MSDFDVIVVGSGISGGWVAKELCEKGFKVAVIERGRKIEASEEYTDFEDPWDHENFGRKTKTDLEQYPIQSEVYAFHPFTRQFWVKDEEHPYETPEGQSFKWRRGHHEGGRSLMWGRQSYRLSEIDFSANKTDGHGVDWPVRYDDIKSWYDYVEKFAGISGANEGLDILPDGVFQKPFEMNCAEAAIKTRLEEKFPNRKMINARVANLTEPTEEQTELGRGQCQSRNRCFRGCSFGAYFSSNAATLPAAKRTGNLTLLTNTVVSEVNLDEQTGRVTGVQAINTETKARSTITARVVFLNASTIATSVILLNSTSEQFQSGLANSSGQVGRNLMDHMNSPGAVGVVPGFTDKYYYGRRPGGVYVPRYRNHTEPGDGYVRGFGFQGAAARLNWTFSSARAGIGEGFKSGIRNPGPWVFWLGGFGEVLPNPDNRVTIHPSRKDIDGIPVPVIDAKIGDNERKLLAQMEADSIQMLQSAGCFGVRSMRAEGEDGEWTFGDAIHEMGTARMGRDPSTSVLNEWNQSHDVPNLFITDGSFMASSGCQNPSLTYMAFSARAADHASELLKQGIL